MRRTEPQGKRPAMRAAGPRVAHARYWVQLMGIEGHAVRHAVDKLWTVTVREYEVCHVAKSKKAL